MPMSDEGRTQDEGRPAAETVRIERWPTEIPLLVLLILAAGFVWVALFVSVIGIIYAVMIGLFLFLSHLGFVAHLRGSAIRLGPDQFPELYDRVCQLSRRAGLDQVPEAYVMQAGGALNALATAFLRARMVVLFSDLLDACEGNEAARDMIIGHELGHLKAGHIHFRSLLFPGMLVPFLGTAYSRAREYTCDRYGAALAGDRQGALTGLAILAGGGTQGPKVNLAVFAEQRAALDTGWMTIGKWLGTHPPLADRIAALEPSLATTATPLTRGPARAVGILVVGLIVPVIGMSWFAAQFATIFNAAYQDAYENALFESADEAHAADRPSMSPLETEAARQRVSRDFRQLAAVAEAFRAERGRLPADGEELYDAWKDVPGASEAPADPFDGLPYSYLALGEHFALSSSGPDGEIATDDDIWWNPPDR